MRSNARRGLLAAVLAVVGLLSVAAFMVATTSIFTLQVEGRVQAGQRQIDLADSLVALALDRVTADTTFGTRGDALQLKSPFGDTASLAFAPNGLSFNNVASTSPRPAPNGTPVPPNSVLLIASTHDHTVTELVQFPGFPFTIATSGTIQLTKCIVAAMPQNSQVLVPASVLSDSTQSDAVTLDGSHVTGDVQACGTVSLLDNSQVDGELRTGRSPRTLPRQDVSSYDPARKLAPYVPLLGTLKAPHLAGFLRANQDLNVTGDLTLDGALIYVNGNLTVTGTLTGTGAVIVTGTTTIQGASLTSIGRAAIISGGDVSITGSGQQQSTFVGLVYTQGTFTANHLTIVGTFVAAGPPDQSSVVLDDTKVVGQPGQLDFKFFGQKQAGMDFPNIYVAGFEYDSTYDPTVASHFFSSTGTPYKIGDLLPDPTKEGIGVTLMQQNGQLTYRMDTGDEGFPNLPYRYIRDGIAYYPSIDAIRQNLYKGASGFGTTNIDNALQQLNKVLGQDLDTTVATNPTNVTVNLNQFLGTADEMQILQWQAR